MKSIPNVKRKTLHGFINRHVRDEAEATYTDELACISQCAVERRCFSVGANPTRQLSLQPVAVGAVHRGNDMD